MKRMIVIILSLLTIASAQTAKKQTKKNTVKQTPAAALATGKDTLSYALGYNIASRVMSDFAKNEIDISPEAFVKGFSAMLTGKKSDLSEDATNFTLMNFQMEMQKKQQAAMGKYNEMMEQNKKEGEAFLAANAKKDSVKTTASGLQYKVLKEGTGKTPVDTSTVTVNYRGQLIDGEVFDESYTKGEPLTMKANQFIKGWTEGLKLMKEGGKYEFYIPSELGYGERGAGEIIKPNSALVFEVELLKVD